MNPNLSLRRTLQARATLAGNASNVRGQGWTCISCTAKNIMIWQSLLDCSWPWRAFSAARTLLAQCSSAKTWLVSRNLIVAIPASAELFSQHLTSFNNLTCYNPWQHSAPRLVAYRKGTVCISTWFIVFVSSLVARLVDWSWKEALYFHCVCKFTRGSTRGLTRENTFGSLILLLGSNHI